MFKDSDFRFIKFSDFIATNKNVLSQVFYAVNFEKFEDDLGELSVRRECIIDRQYRSFSSDLTFTQDRNYNFVYLKDTIIDRLNKYYISTFKKEMEMLIARKLVSKQWFEEILELLNGNNIALIRLGKNGSDSKVYQDKSIVRIKTKKNIKESKSLFLKHYLNQQLFGLLKKTINPKRRLLLVGHCLNLTQHQKINCC